MAWSPPAALALLGVEATSLHLILDFLLEVILALERAFIQLWKDILDHNAKVSVAKLEIQVENQIPYVDIELRGHVVRPLLPIPVASMWCVVLLRISLSVISFVVVGNQLEAFVIIIGLVKRG
jgi:hypothetical protein